MLDCPLWRLYRCRAGWVFLAVATPDEADALRAVLAEAGHPVSGFEQLGQVSAERDAQAWEDVLGIRGIGCVRADTPGLAAFLKSDRLARAWGLVEEAPHRVWGSYLRHGRIVDYDGASTLRGACALGEHTRAILDEFGCSAADVERLLAARAAVAT